MDDWAVLRTVLAVVAWATVAGGAVLAITWLVHGGGRALGPEDDIAAESGGTVDRGRRRTTSFGSAQVGIHGLLGVLTASLVTYAAVRDSDRQTGYLAVLLAVLITAIPGTLMFRKWRAGARPAVGARRERAEDHLPRPVVYLHGAAALTTAVLVVVLFVVE